MKQFFSIALLMIGVCVSCEIRPTPSQTPQSEPSASAQPSTQAGTNAADTGPCSLVIDQAPIMNGLRLGMTPEQVLALFPGSNEDAEVRADLSRPPRQLGVSSLLIRPGKFQSKEKFVGVSQITFTLLDGRVSSINVGYNGPQYSHVDEFVTKFVEGTNLPAADSWEEYVGLDNQMKTLRCKDFETRVFVGGEGGNLNYVLMTDLIAAKKLKERRAKAAAKATP